MDRGTGRHGPRDHRRQRRPQRRGAQGAGRLREALQTLPFFGSGKVVWLQNCNFLGDERAASAQAVTETLAALAQELKEFAWQNVRLLISAGKVDKRKVFYKTLDKLGQVESFAGWSVDDRDWADQAEAWARKALRARQKEISDEALAELISRVGPNARQLDNEIEKSALYVGDREGDRVRGCRRDLHPEQDGARLCPGRCPGRSGFAAPVAPPGRGVVGGEAGSAEVRDRAALRADCQGARDAAAQGDAARRLGEAGGGLRPVQGAMERVPAEQLPQDKRFNPLALNPYVLYKALPQVKRYSEAELVRAMELLLQCNQRLVSSSLDESLVLQQTLVQIVGNASPETGRRPDQTPEIA